MGENGYRREPFGTYRVEIWFLIGLAFAVTALAWSLALNPNLPNMDMIRTLSARITETQHAANVQLTSAIEKLVPRLEALEDQAFQSRR